MNTGQEHLVLSQDGQLLGLYTIDIDAVKKVHGGGWEAVDKVIEIYSHLNPKEVAETIKNNTHTKDTAYNEHTSNASKTFRHALSLPVGLVRYLEELNPTLFSNPKTMHEFMLRYKGFRTCKTV